MIGISEFEKKQILFAFLSAGEKVSFSNDNIVIKTADGKIKHQSTCYRLFLLFVIGHITITSGILQRASRFGFGVVLMSNGLKVYDFIGSKMEGNVLLRRHQYDYKGLDLAKHILENKVHNQRILLEEERHKNAELKQVIEKLKAYEKRISAYDGKDLSELLGLEGLAARLFFSSFYREEEWHGRKPRIKPDYINSTLDIGYTLLFNYIEALLNVYGFDTYCGVLHREFYMRKSLVCDLVEPFRTLIDRQVRKSVHLKQCKPEDFQNINGRYLLKWEKNTEYVRFLVQSLLERKMEIFKYIQGYYRAFMKQKAAKDYPVFWGGVTDGNNKL